MVAQTRPTKNATTTTTATTPPNANSTNQVKVFPSSQTNNGIVPTATATPTAAVASAPAAPASNPSTAVVAPVTTSKDQIKIYSKFNDFLFWFLSACVRVFSFLKKPRSFFDFN